MTQGITGTTIFITKISFIYLLGPTQFNNNQNSMRDAMATFTHPEAAIGDGL